MYQCISINQVGSHAQLSYTLTTLEEERVSAEKGEERRGEKRRGDEVGVSVYDPHFHLATAHIAYPSTQVRLGLETK